MRGADLVRAALGGPVRADPARNSSAGRNHVHVVGGYDQPPGALCAKAGLSVLPDCPPAWAVRQHWTQAARPVADADRSGLSALWRDARIDQRDEIGRAHV